MACPQSLACQCVPASDSLPQSIHPSLSPSLYPSLPQVVTDREVGSSHAVWVVDELQPPKGLGNNTEEEDREEIKRLKECESRHERVGSQTSSSLYLQLLQKSKNLLRPKPPTQLCPSGESTLNSR